MRLCVECGGAGRHFHMRDGKPAWDTCKICLGRGVTEPVPETDDSDGVPMEEWFDDYERNGGLRA